LNKKSIALILPLVFAMLIFTGGIPFAHATGSLVSHFQANSSGSVFTLTDVGVTTQVGDFILMTAYTNHGCAANNPGAVTDTAGNTYTPVVGACTGTQEVIMQSATAVSSATFDVTLDTGGNNVYVYMDVTVWRGYQTTIVLGTSCSPGFPPATIFAYGDADIYSMIGVPSNSPITPTTSGWIDSSNGANADGAVDDGYFSNNGHMGGTHGFTFSTADSAHTICESLAMQNVMTFSLSHGSPVTIAPGSSGMIQITSTFVSGSNEVVFFDDPSFSFAGELCRVGVSDHPSPGVTCAFSPHNCDPMGTTCSVQLTLTAAMNAEAGTFSVVVKGAPFSYGGVNSAQTTTISYTITGGTWYNHLSTVNPAPSGQVWDESNSLAPNSYASLQGEYSTNWVGNVLNKVTFDLSWDTNNGCTPTGTFTIGVYDGSQVTPQPPVYTIHTGNIADLSGPYGYNNPGTPAVTRLVVSGLSHTMAANEVIGFTASDDGHGCGGTPSNIAVTSFCDTGCGQSEPGGNFIDWYPSSGQSPIANGSPNYAISAQFETTSTPPPAPQPPSTRASVFVLAFMVIAMASIVVVAYERPDKATEAVKYVGPVAVGLAIVFVVLHAVGF
jgi:hypothetical protein